jgi:hypothetical protein
MSGSTTCIFCKRPLADVGGRALEHVIPGWLQREWNLSANQLSPMHYNIEGDVVSREITMSLLWWLAASGEITRQLLFS